ncbi:hypothetical protein HRJ34_17880 [Rhizorhabdus wittichii]|uniref:Uncharacterized protein n=2 Tax=Rhizorhabdus wittichii TaxID=160791 RepID=A0A975D036_9SPHN|nr:hypothetical protein HRJ34_17880 [Rhizorhabdus wittichii]
MQMSALEILVNQLYQKALTGDEKAINLLLKLVEKANLATLEGRTGEPIRIIVEGGLPEIERISYDPADDDSKAPDGEKRCKEDDDPEETAV